MLEMSFRPSDRIRTRFTRNRRLISDSRVVPVLCVQGLSRRQIRFPFCEFEGFYPREVNGNGTFAWTRQTANIACHFSEATCLRHVWISVQSIRPGGSRVVVRVADGPSVEFRRVQGRRRLAISLGGKIRTSTLHISLECETFVPDQVLANGDQRELGIAVRRIVLGRNLLACVRGLQSHEEGWHTIATDRLRRAG